MHLPKFFWALSVLAVLAVTGLAVAAACSDDDSDPDSPTTADTTDQTTDSTPDVSGDTVGLPTYLVDPWLCNTSSLQVDDLSTDGNDAQSPTNTTAAATRCPKSTMNPQDSGGTTKNINDNPTTIRNNTCPHNYPCTSPTAATTYTTRYTYSTICHDSGDPSTSTFAQRSRAACASAATKYNTPRT